eukprot:128859_1
MVESVMTNDDNDNKQKEEERSLLLSPVKKTKKSQTYNVYFTNEEKFDENIGEKKAIKWFKKFNNREPTKFELNTIKQFVKSEEKEQLIEFQYNIVPINNNYDNYFTNKQMKIKTNSVIDKKSSTKYTLNFKDKKNNKQNKKEAKQTIEWFKKFNKREPTNTEIQQMKEFLQSS